MTPAARRVPASPDPSAQGLRIDARHNRDRILAAARRVYARDGIEASMASVAREAGVGIATLFRHFPAREDLVAAVFADTMQTYADAATTALADPDPWRGFTWYIETVCGMQAADRGFAEVLTMTFPSARALEAKRDEAYRGFSDLVVRAKEAGRLRPEFTTEDLVILLMANAGVIAATAGAAPEAWRRLVGCMIQSYAVPDPANTEPLPPAPTPTALYRAMIRLSRTPAERR
ncbi:TetR/AcrR family transcriptional regulator [Nonomuraea aurantiaca]|uniref:TetR/AcrR family transcriptional regulator n=1 Tax=Nonomuraea aurantiaca TaxID=2878562 RepID=UPI001CD9A7C4|nr:TetR/AcrR family transcriptional regulator [Nonomuraea aurantiaca]MCA2226180.1 TetR/AcrR family transcriptional regulator [Nonomuraea aurantiaca]